MPDILHRVGINTTPTKIFTALTTIDGLRHWWTIETSGNANSGGTIDFKFCTMKVVEAAANSSVTWKCVGGPEEWKGTVITFKLVRQGKQTFVLFTHAKWKKPSVFMHHCSTKWAVFLLSLRDWIERGEGRPAPYDVKIHVGD